MKKIIRHARKIQDIILHPIINETPLIIIISLLLIAPTLLDTFYYERESSSILHIIRFNKNGAGIPYITFLPFLISYTCAILVTITNKTFSLILKFLSYTVFTSLFLINIFLLVNFNTMITPSILTLIAETNKEEATEFLYAFLFTKKSTLFFFGLFILIYTIIFFDKKKNKFTFLSNKYLKMVLIIIVTYLTIRSIPVARDFSQMFKCNSVGEVETWATAFQVNTNTLSATIYSLFDLFISQKELDYIIQNTKKVSESNPTCTSSDSINIILVIGESYSKYHCQLYGYYINNTPNLNALRKDSCLFIFKNVITPYNLTSFALKNIFSTNDIAKGQYWSKSPLFPTIFKKAGYSVYFWDNQMSKIRGGASDFSLNGIIHNSVVSSSSYDFTNEKNYEFDEQLLHSFFKEFDKRKNSKNLVILHLLGQHIIASERYPHNRFDKFSHKDINRPDLNIEQKQIIAEYENATLYNDYIINMIIDFFKESNSIVVYLSDHGEEVYDYRNVLGRTHEKNKSPKAIKYQYDIPFFIWCSNKYKANNSEILNVISERTNVPYITDKLPHMLFGLASIRTKYYQNDCDIFSKSYKCNKRLVQGYIEYDRIVKD